MYIHIYMYTYTHVYSDTLILYIRTASAKYSMLKPHFFDIAMENHHLLQKQHPPTKKWAMFIHVP